MTIGILFDFNGTLVWDGPKHKEAWDVFSYKYRGKAISEPEMEQMHGKTNKAIIQMLMKDMSEEKREQLSKAKEALYRDCCLKDPQQYQLVPGLTAFLDELKKQNIPMTICTASIKENVDFFLTYFQLSTWFDPSHIVYDDGTYENKVAMFQEGARRIGVPIEDCIVFEDSISGIEYAHLSHVRSIIAMTSPQKRLEYEKLAGVSELIYDFKQVNLSSLLK